MHLSVTDQTNINQLTDSFITEYNGNSRAPIMITRFYNMEFASISFEINNFTIKLANVL